MKTFVLILSALTILSGCEKAIFDDGLRSAVRESLKDPDSAKWGSKVIYKNRACQIVNSKNAYGGYTGNQTAWLQRMGGDSWYLHKINDDGCYESSLKSLVKLDEEEAEFAKKVVALLNSKGYKVVGVPVIAYDDNTAEKCLRQASSVMTAHRISAEKAEGSSDRREWLSLRDSEYQSLEAASDCKPAK